MTRKILKCSKPFGFTFCQEYSKEKFLSIKPKRNEHLSEEVMKKRKCALGHLYKIVEDSKLGDRKVDWKIIHDKLVSLLPTVKSKCGSGKQEDAVLIEF